MADETPAKSVWVEFISKFETKSLKDAEKQLGTTTKALRKMGKAAAVAFAAAAAGLALMAREVLKLGDTVDKQSKKIGESEEGYQKLVSIFDDMGINAAAASKGVLFLRKELGRGQKASIEFRDAMSQAGLTPGDLEGKDAFDQYKVIIDKIRDLDAETQTSVAQALLGRGGKELGKILNAPAEALDEAAQRFADKGGPLFEEGEAARVATIKDELKALNDARKKVGKEVVFAVFGEVDPQDIRELTKTFADMARWVRENKTLVKTLVQGFFVLMGVLAAIGAVAAKVAILGTALGSAFVAAAAAAVAPVLAVVAALTAVGLAVRQIIVHWDDLGRSIDFVWDKFKAFMSDSALGKVFKFVSETILPEESAPRQSAFAGVDTGGGLFAAPTAPTEFGIANQERNAPSAEQLRGVTTNNNDNSQQVNNYTISTTMSQAQLEAFMRKRDAKKSRAGQRN